MLKFQQGRNPADRVGVGHTREETAKILMTYGIPRVKCIISIMQERVTIERHIETTTRQAWKLRARKNFYPKNKRFYSRSIGESTANAFV